MKSLYDVVSFLVTSDGTVFVFANFNAVTHRILLSLESKLDNKELDMRVDRINIHGSQMTNEKLGFNSVFELKIIMTKFKSRVLVVTAALQILKLTMKISVCVTF